jgi:HAD superfamily hydrolase (TIGR01509 family)
MERALKMRQIQVLLIDLGEVVVNVNPDRARDAWAELTGTPQKHFDQAFFDSHVKRDMDIGVLSASEGVDRVLSLNLSDGLRAETVIASWNAMLTTRPQVTEFLHQASKTVRCGVISNTDPIHAAWIEAECGLSGFVEKWTYSFDVQSLKPEPPLYLAALSNMQVAPEHALLIDDRADNITTARALGIHAEQIRGAESVGTALRTHGLIPNEGGQA